jgi:peptide/nickel transport system substrate-binding protein
MLLLQTLVTKRRAFRSAAGQEDRSTRDVSNPSASRNRSLRIIVTGNRRSRRSIHLTASVIAVLSITVLSACGSDVKAGPGGTTATASVLTIQGDAGNPTLIEDFNPYIGTDLHGTYLLYEPLEIASGVNGAYTPYLATGYKFTNPTTLVYTLRSGVKWSDGQAFTSKDVLFSFDLLKKYPALDTTGVWSEIKSVTASGNSVTFIFKAPNVPFASTIAGIPIVPEHIWSKVASPAKFTNDKPVGDGPYVLGRFSPTSYTLTKSSTYWDAATIAPTSVVFPAEASNQNINQLDVTSGQFDWAYTYVPDVKATYVSKDPATRSYWFPPGGTIGLFLNLTKAPYDNVDFRRALSLSLQRNEIAQKAINGYLGAASMSGIILPNLKAYLDPSLPDQGMVTQNLSQAKALFADAGFHMQGSHLTGSNGKTVAMTITLPNSYSDWLDAAQEIRQQLGTVGIDVSLDTPQQAQYQSAVDSGNFDAAIGGFGGTGSPYNDYNDALNSSFATPINTATTNNFERYKSSTIDKALAKLASATTLSAQKQATYTLEQQVSSQVPIVLLYYGGSWGLFQTTHFTGWPSAKDPYALPTNYDNAILEVVSHLKKV